MKKFTQILFFTLFAVSMTSISLAARDTELEMEMKNISQNAKTLKQIISDPSKKTESLSAIGRMIKSAETARTLTPKKASTMAEPDRAQFIADFQKQIDVLTGQLKKIQTDITDGKTGEAESDFNKIIPIKREGHKKFSSD